MGVSPFTVLDARVLLRIDRQWSVAFGCCNFHPYPQRSLSAELKVDL